MQSGDGMQRWDGMNADADMQMCSMTRMREMTSP